MKKVFALVSTLTMLSLGGLAQADVFNLGTGFTNLETVTVSNPGNTGELSGTIPGEYGPARVCGAVDYKYNIGKYEVTAKQYTDFLNVKAKTDDYGLYNINMTSKFGCQIQRSGSCGSYTYSVTADFANRPVNYVSFWDACRFVNWISNGQGNGDTETGSYTIAEYNGYDGRNVQRNTGFRWAITSEDEWYKAAYFKGEGTSAGYWECPTQRDSINTQMANIKNSINHTTDVGNYAYSSAYGTFDQAGNVWEWNEAIVFQGQAHSCRGVRGGSFVDCDVTTQAFDRAGGAPPTYEDYQVGFRVSEVPEQSSIIALAMGLAGILGIRRQR